MSRTLRHAVAATITRRRLWTAGQRVAVAVSGGLDSVVLLDLLHDTQPWHRGALSVVTVDHGTRPGSTEDAVFVARLADRYGLGFQSFGLGLGPEASEATLREGRLAALARLDVDVVAFGHHRDDQAETLLINLMRGSGPRGLGGLVWRREPRPRPDGGRVPAWVRPLLDVGHDELEAWARERGLAWREDPTNRDPRFLRNRVRQEVLPLLEAIRPGASRALAGCAEEIGAAAAVVDAAVAAHPDAAPVEGSWPASFVATAPIAVVRRALRDALPEALGVHLAAIRAAAETGAGDVHLPGGRRVVVERGRVTIRTPGG